MQSNQAFRIRMLFCLLIIDSLFFCQSLLAIDQKDFDVPFINKPIRNRIEIEEAFGPPVLMSEFNDTSGRTVYLFYEGIRFALFDNHGGSDFQISFVVMDPRIELFGAVRIGIKKDTVLQRLGKPDSEENGRMIYRGNDHYSIIFLDRYSQVISINWSFYVD